jgi:hypothetical protein
VKVRVGGVIVPARGVGVAVGVAVGVIVGVRVGVKVEPPGVSGMSVPLGVKVRVGGVIVPARGVDVAVGVTVRVGLGDRVVGARLGVGVDDGPGVTVPQPVDGGMHPPPQHSTVPSVRTPQL